MKVSTESVKIGIRMLADPITTELNDIIHQIIIIIGKKPLNRMAALSGSAARQC